MNSHRISRYAIASLVLGVLSFFVGVLGALVGPISIVLGVIAVRDIRNNSARTSRKLAVVGILLGGLAAFLAVTIYDWNAVLDDTPVQKTHLQGPVHFP